MLPGFPSQVVSLTFWIYASIRMPGSSTLQQISAYSVSETAAKINIFLKPCKLFKTFSYLCPKITSH